MMSSIGREKRVGNIAKERSEALKRSQCLLNDQPLKVDAIKKEVEGYSHLSPMWKFLKKISVATGIMSFIIIKDGFECYIRAHSTDQNKINYNIW